MTDNLNKKKVHALPIQRLTSIIECSERAFIMIKVLSEHLDISSAEMAQLEMCAADVETIINVFHDMNSVHTEALECVETYNINKNAPFYLMDNELN